MAVIVLILEAQPRRSSAYPSVVHACGGSSSASLSPVRMSAALEFSPRPACEQGRRRCFPQTGDHPAVGFFALHTVLYAVELTDMSAHRPPCSPARWGEEQLATRIEAMVRAVHPLPLQTQEPQHHAAAAAQVPLLCLSATTVVLQLPLTNPHHLAVTVQHYRQRRGDGGYLGGSG